MAIEVRCCCGKCFEVNDDLRRDEIECPDCGRTVAVPSWDDVVTGDLPLAGSGSDSPRSSEPAAAAGTTGSARGAKAEETFQATALRAGESSRHTNTLRVVWIQTQRLGKRAWDWAKPFLAAAWAEVRQAARYYWLNRRAFLKRFQEYTSWIPDYGREIQVAASESRATAVLREGRWTAQLPDCCVVCGAPTARQLEVESRQVADVTRAFWAPVVGLAAGIVLALLFGSVWWMFAFVLCSFLPGYWLRREVSLELKLKRCESHVRDSVVPQVFAFDRLLIIRTGHERVKQQYFRDGREFKSLIWPNSPDEPIVQTPIPLDDDSAAEATGKPVPASDDLPTISPEEGEASDDGRHEPKDGSRTTTKPDDEAAMPSLSSPAAQNDFEAGDVDLPVPDAKRSDSVTDEENEYRLAEESHAELSHTGRCKVVEGGLQRSNRGDVMQIPVKCDKCGKTYRFTEDLAGKSVKCKNCEEWMPVPDTDSLSRIEKISDAPRKTLASVKKQHDRLRSDFLGNPLFWFISAGAAVTVVAVVIVVAVLVGGSDKPAGDRPEASASGGEIGKWIGILRGDDLPVDRIRATAALMRIGEPAIKPLLEALEESPTPIVLKRPILEEVRLNAEVADIAWGIPMERRFSDGSKEPASLWFVSTMIPDGTRKTVVLGEPSRARRMVYSLPVAAGSEPVPVTTIAHRPMSWEEYALWRIGPAVVKSLDALESHSDEQMRNTAVALAKAIQSAASVATRSKPEMPEEESSRSSAEKLMRELESWNLGAGKAGRANELAKLGPEAKSVVPLLMQYLDDDFMRAYALWAIPHIDPEGESAETVIPLLLEWLGKSSPNGYSRTQFRDKWEETAWKKTGIDFNFFPVLALRCYGARVVPQLVDLLKKTPKWSNRRAKIIKILGEIGPDAREAGPLIVQSYVGCGFDAWYGNSRWQTALVLEALGKTGTGASVVVPDLVEGLRMENSQNNKTPTESHICQALAGFGPEAKSAVPELIRATERGFFNESVKALGAIGPDAKSAVPAIVKYMEGSNPYYAIPAIDALGNIGSGTEEAASSLIKIINSLNRDEVRVASARALIKAAPEAERTVIALIHALNDRSDAVRDAAFESLVQLRPAADSALQSAITDWRILVRTKAKAILEDSANTSSY